MRAPSPVLLIEDDPDTRAALTQLLSGAGFSVFSSDEGRKALELAAMTRPAVVVVDLVTEGMSGWEFLERSRALPALAGVPIVVVTGTPGAPPRDAAAVFRKPIDPPALIRTLRRLTGRT